MNRSRLLLIGFVALALGAFVSLNVYRTLKANTASANVPGMDVVVAAADLPIGKKIEDKDVKIVRYASGEYPANSFHSKSAVVNHGVLQPIMAGEFVLPNKVAGQNDYGMPSLIPPGMRAVSVRVNEVVAVAGFVQPGSRVDVLLTGALGGGEQQTTTVLENVEVIASGTRLERNAHGEASSAPVITLLVTPENAQKLTLASNQGRIQLALRNPSDVSQGQLTSMKSGVLYRNGVPIAPGLAAKKQAAPAPAPEPPPAAYSIEVLHGDRREVAKFDNDHQ
ncbi:MAG: Flp pilus assembly protein CpaB [Acidobacteriales bacterium]|nr:Flp pilus assembly protein CpaB [Terriglobales bacterium]